MSPLLFQTREWLIQPDALHAMVQASRTFHDRAATLTAAPSNSLLSVENGVGVVAIEGPILRKPDLFARAFMGANDSDEIGDAIREASERDDIKAVFLDIDSPGGTVAGTPELAAAVASLNERKPVYAFSSGLMASAAYWIASQARAIYATPSAQVGSIGVVQAFLDQSAALESAGLKVEVFSVGKYKAMGAPGSRLTDDQRELIQSNLEDIAADFHAAVLARGRSIPAEAMEGQTFSGRQAQRYNLAGMVPDRQEAMRRLRIYHAAVDTESRAMSTALEDQLAEARNQVDDLAREYKAQTDLLAEASANFERLRNESDALTAEIDSLKSERDSARNESTALQARINELQASQSDFDNRLQIEVARLLASTGTATPALVSPAGDERALPQNSNLQEMVAHYDRLVTDRRPEEAATFYQQNLAQHFTR
ncbi:MAG: S49 family peptidase [Verrucomicrobiota bacterium]